MKANTIQKVLQDPTAAAQELRLSVTSLQDLRRSWIRRLEGQCGACGEPSGSKPVCRECHEKGVKFRAPGRYGVLRVLRELDPDAPVLNRVCRSCGTHQTLTARQIIQQYRVGPLPLQEWECLTCRRNRPLTHRPFQGIDIAIALEKLQ